MKISKVHKSFIVDL